MAHSASADKLSSTIESLYLMVEETKKLRNDNCVVLPISQLEELIDEVQDVLIEMECLLNGSP